MFLYLCDRLIYYKVFFDENLKARSAHTNVRIANVLTHGVRILVLFVVKDFLRNKWCTEKDDKERDILRDVLINIESLLNLQGNLLDPVARLPDDVSL